MYSATNLYSEVSVSVLHKLILLFRHNFMTCSRFLTSVKTDHPKIPKIYLSWQRDYMSKLVYLQEFLSDSSGLGVKIWVYK